MITPKVSSKYGIKLWALLSEMEIYIFSGRYVPLTTKEESLVLRLETLYSLRLLQATGELD